MSELRLRNRCDSSPAAEEQNTVDLSYSNAVLAKACESLHNVETAGQISACGEEPP